MSHSADFESFHLASRPASRRASPVSLTPAGIQQTLTDSYIAEARATEDDSVATRSPRSSRFSGSNLINTFAESKDGHFQRSVSPTFVHLQWLASQMCIQAHPKTRDEAPPPRDALAAIPGVNSQPAEAWVECLKVLREYDEQMVRGWKEDVDSLLVFAGLFSAVVTTFNVEAYKLLQEDSEEASADLLRQISMQLASGAQPKPSDVFQPEARSIRINILWFSSLVLSLISASVGILTKQWLREYISNSASSTRENARIRQIRHEGFVRWRIPLTIALLPVLLQVALALFLIGLLDLLWSLDNRVASVITTLVAISLAFLVVTTILPTFSISCPYKSPQSLGVFLIVQSLRWLSSWVATKLYSFMGYSHRQWPLYVNVSLFKNRRRRTLAGWLRSFMEEKHCTNWRDREKAMAREDEAALDARILVDADETFMDDDFLEHVLRPCLASTGHSTLGNSLFRIATHRSDHVQDGDPHWRHTDDADGGVNLLLHIVIDSLTARDQYDSTTVSMLTVANNLCRAIPFEKGHPDTLCLYQRLFDALSSYLAKESLVQRASFGLMRSVWFRSTADVSPSVIQNIATFAHASKVANDIATFQLACEMALAFSTAPNFPSIAFNAVRPSLQLILQDLEAHFSAPSTAAQALHSCDAILPRSPLQPAVDVDPLPGQSAAILLSLEELMQLDPDLFTPKLESILSRVDVPDNASMESVLRRRLACARDARRTRVLHWRPRTAQRRRAIDVRAGNVAENLNLLLPDTPIVPNTAEVYDGSLGGSPRASPTSPAIEIPSGTVGTALEQSPTLPKLEMDITLFPIPESPESVAAGRRGGAARGDSPRTPVGAHTAPRTMPGGSADHHQHHRHPSRAFLPSPEPLNWSPFSCSGPLSDEESRASPGN
ncbi:uncharacterized protein BXZ73DRAFT_89140 [Epithele typhae]|uniref:uncharacterized protein n=1 Tax=Epithele typhae TaxID=378194 RepID=UPI0020088A95|nr:uncharacterized protein BXZ73DRAFT_89140 [Epithele typhae]KAH9939057.1 hypothetical protein BXZ73DRAFT_89140 [Epithele typhae]